MPWYRKAHDLGFSDAAWRDFPYLASILDTAVSGYGDALEDLHWETDPDTLKEYSTAIQDRLTILQQRIARHDAAWCEGCELVEKQMLMSALVKFDAVRKGRIATLTPASLPTKLSQMRRPCWPSRRQEHFATNARRAWFWTVQASPDSIPENHSPEEQLKRLQHSQQLAKEFLATYPKAWMADRHLGRIDFALANLFAKMGRTSDAVSAAEAGAGLFDQDSTRLLADWYRTGSGPVPRDLDKAKHYDALLTARTWGLERYTIPVTAMWLDKGKPFSYDIYIEDPHDEKR